MVHNDHCRERYHKVLSLDYFDYESEYFSDNGVNDPVNKYVEQDIKEEENTKLYQVLMKLSDKQKYIIIQCVVYGRMQADVAKEIGSTRQNVTNILRRTLKQIREDYGIADKAFPTNHFFRAEN